MNEKSSISIYLSVIPRCQRFELFLQLFFVAVFEVIYQFLAPRRLKLEKRKTMRSVGLQGTQRRPSATNTNQLWQGPLRFLLDFHSAESRTIGDKTITSLQTRSVLIVNLSTGYYLSPRERTWSWSTQSRLQHVALPLIKHSLKILISMIWRNESCVARWQSLLFIFPATHWIVVATGWLFEARLLDNLHTWTPQVLLYWPRSSDLSMCAQVSSSRLHKRNLPALAPLDSGV